MLVIAKTSKKDVQQLACTVISTKPNEWVKHVCNVPGCKEGYISVDGNEKLKRPMCAAPQSKQHLTGNSKSMPQMLTCYENTPLYGNSSLKPSKYWVDHLHLQKVGSKELNTNFNHKHNVTGTNNPPQRLHASPLTKITKNIPISLMLHQSHN